jgi:BASS family bile acid:Na+ symporter
MLNALTNAFPWWVLGGSALALWEPRLFTWFSGLLIPLGLGIIMLGMGLTLGLDDARRVATRRAPLVAGVALQYAIMPSLGWGLATLFQLPPPLAAGLILVSCCPGGTASNVITFLARADVALSVAMTAASTVVAIAMTPLLTAWLVGSRIEVSVGGLLLSTLQVVALPLLAAAALKRWAPGTVAAILPAAPLAAVVTITLIVGSIIGGGRDAIVAAAPRLLAAVASLHAGGFALGFLFARLAGGGVRTARTISIEVGMQNSGLGVVLARQNFSDPLVAIPSAISSLFHSLIGSLLAAYWRRTESPAVADREGPQETAAARRQHG